MVKTDNNFIIGECNTLLDIKSLIDLIKIDKELKWIVNKINFSKELKFYNLKNNISYSSVFFVLEQIFIGLKKEYPILYNSEFTKGKEEIFINDIIWLYEWKKYNEKIFIEKIHSKIKNGFSCIKIKINKELLYLQYNFLKKIKNIYPFLKIRIDANGCFKNKFEALYFINKFYELDIICLFEQPILPGNWNDISYICKNSESPIALDEELIGIVKLKEKRKLLDFINPEYIVIRPSICGGFNGSEEWIKEAYKRNIRWYVSSSLESNIGINAIVQWTFIMNKKYSLGNKIYHGLNTTCIYINELNTSPFVKGKVGFTWNNKFLYKEKNLITCG
ncbi:enolase-like domain-containing protein [Blattabacterium cuenoti]|uniref:O-succinylbenzoate synthase n=1 Tax=Blattabacterium cuenoti TaxID=1653831 RepID=UPI001EEA1138|nr:O-succinylbenzoate synthase [Blattabacterium cuenoti]